MKFKLNLIFIAIFALAHFLPISKQLFSMDLRYFGELHIPGPREYYSDLDLLNDKLLQSMTIYGCVSRHMHSQDFFYLTNKFIQNTSSLYSNSPWLYNTNINDQLSNIWKQNFNGEEELAISTFPCIAKLIVPQNTRVAIIGDIHAEMSTVKALFYSLKNKYFLNEFMQMPDNCRIIFLGDYTDRGDYNLQVLCSILILSAKNPDKVFLLKGNHESLISQEKSKIISEIKEIERNETVVNILISNIISVYELMPTAMFLGFQGQRQTRFYLLAHGGPDIRYDYTDFLNLHENPCFWMLTADDSLKTLQSRKWLECIYKCTREYKDISKEYEDVSKKCEDIRNSLTLHINERLDQGFLWNDIITYPCSLPVLNSILRGETCIELNPKFVRNFLESFATENSEIVGVIRAHQHFMGKIMAKKAGLNLGDETSSPSCAHFTGRSKDGKPLTQGSPVFLNNTFSIVTVISGPIATDDGKYIPYLPTFLELRCLENGIHRIEAIEYQA